MSYSKAFERPRHTPKPKLIKRGAVRAEVRIEAFDTVYSAARKIADERDGTSNSRARQILMELIEVGDFSQDTFGSLGIMFDLDSMHWYGQRIVDEFEKAGCDYTAFQKAVYKARHGN
ncbi:hypothetical protein GC174_15150 [bacterium]|nr:hypothetical protein [bacterium]